MRYVLFAAMLSFISGIAYAAGPAPAATQPQSTSQQQATRVETDKKTGAIRFIVNGKEVARIDATGLHVTGDVDYTGALTDK
jgi:hypothetical protein